MQPAKMPWVNFMHGRRCAGCVHAGPWLGGGALRQAGAGCLDTSKGSIPHLTSCESPSALPTNTTPLSRYARQDGWGVLPSVSSCRPPTPPVLGSARSGRTTNVHFNTWTDRTQDAPPPCMHPPQLAAAADSHTSGPHSPQRPPPPPYKLTPLEHKQMQSPRKVAKEKARPICVHCAVGLWQQGGCAMGCQVAGDTVGCVCGGGRGQCEQARRHTP